VIRGAHLARSKIEKKTVKVLIEFADEVLICGLKEGIKAVSFL
jgi:hypothetical protein